MSTDQFETLRAQITTIVGPKGLVTEASEMTPYLEDRRGRFRGATPFVVRPGATAEVAAVVKLCAQAGTPVVPQGGNTGLVAGGIPFERGDEVLVNLARMNRVREIDAVDYTMTVEAGCILQDLQDKAAEADRIFPLSLGAEGSCQIGGNIATNAGGIHVLRYGNTRDLVLGLEVVLPNGEIWNGLRKLRKDNTGYDLKQLFIGAEGTLGIITAAVLKLFAKPKATAIAFAAVPDPQTAIRLLEQARSAAGESVNCFELIPRIGVDFALKHVSGVTDPLANRYDWYVLMELASSAADSGLGEIFEQLLGTAYENGLILDAALATSEAQAQAFWRIREGLVEAQKHEGGSIKHDIAVPVSSIPVFIERATAAVQRLVPGIRPVTFGHLGDGNLHFNLTQPVDADSDAFLARWDEVNALVHDIVVDLDGSISAEHGIGRIKVDENRRLKPPVEIALMRQVKAALDPANLMNPGKVVSRQEPV